jgi:hypothetical protein
MEDVGMFCGPSVKVLAIWYILWPLEYIHIMGKIKETFSAFIQHFGILQLVNLHYVCTYVHSTFLPAEDGRGF